MFKVFMLLITLSLFYVNNYFDNFKKSNKKSNGALLRCHVGTARLVTLCQSRFQIYFVCFKLPSSKYQ